MAINCIDLNVPRDRSAHDRQARELLQVAPRTGTLVAYFLLGCASWPVRTDARFTGPYTATGAPPALVLGTRQDSRTPYAAAEAMTATLARATLVTVEGIGHGVYGFSGPCADGMVERYLLTGERPPAGTICDQQPPADPSLPPAPAAG